MVILTLRSVYLTPGNGIRHHGSPTQQNLPGTTTSQIQQSPGNTYTTLPAQTPWTIGNQTFMFMFWSVNYSSMPTSNLVAYQPSLGSIQILNSDVQVWAWYYLAGPPGGPSPVYIDAFDILLGDLSNDPNIVNVATDPSQNANANSQGYVTTSSKEEDIQAYNNLQDGAVFDHWGWIWGDNQSTTPSISVDGVNIMQLDTSKGSGGYWLAFYNPPVKHTLLEHGTWNKQLLDVTQKQLLDVSQKQLLEFGQKLLDGSYSSMGLEMYVRHLSQRVEKLETQAAEGKSFIRPEERPRVGRAVKKKS